MGNTRCCHLLKYIRPNGNNFARVCKCVNVSVRSVSVRSVSVKSVSVRSVYCNERE